jgi:hypothetical protein
VVFVKAAFFVVVLLLLNFSVAAILAAAFSWAAFSAAAIAAAASSAAALDARILHQNPGIAQNLDTSRWATAHHPKFVTSSDILLWLPGVPGWLGYVCRGRIGFFRCRGCRMGGQGMQGGILVGRECVNKCKHYQK